MASSDRIRSLDIVLEEVRTERNHQLQHFDALDQKAGIVLGFAGALVALTPTRPDILLFFGRAAVVSGFRRLGGDEPYDRPPAPRHPEVLARVLDGVEHIREVASDLGRRDVPHGIR